MPHRPFHVIDKRTGRRNDEIDLENIVLTEAWADGLMYCDMEGFAVLEDGSLILLDECGNHAYCPADRFEVVWEADDA